jgi:hypothetical protein
MTYTRRGFQLMRDAILAVDDAGELEKLRALALDQWGGDPFHAELEALLDRRAAEIAERERQAELFGDTGHEAAGRDAR